MKKKTIIIGLLIVSLFITGCEKKKEKEYVQQRQQTSTEKEYVYTDIQGEEIVDELLLKVRMPIGSKDENIFYQKKKLLYNEIPNKDLLLLGLNSYLQKNPTATTMTVEEMKKEIYSIVPEEVKYNDKTVKESDCLKLELKGINYNIVNNCQRSGYYERTIIAADDVDNTAIEIAEKIAYIEINGNEKILYSDIGGKEIKRVNVNDEIDLKNITGVTLVKYTFIKYQDNYYLYSSEKIG